jgi:hypothetical protein
MDDPPFYRDDVQAYYDMRVASGDSQPEAMSKTKRHFKLRALIVTPTGEVRSPGVVDDPSPPETAAPPPEGGEEEPPEGEEGPDKGDPGSQIGDEDPHGSDPKKGKEEAALDARWLAFLSGESPVDAFEAEEAWEAPDLEEHWRPAHLPKRNRRAHVAENVTREQARLYEKFQRLVNMRAGELRAHLRSDALAETIAAARRQKRGPLVEGKRMARYVLLMKATPVHEWTAELWEQCRQVVSFIERTRRNNTPLLDENGRATRKLMALRTWGHNPTVPAYVTEAEIEPLLGHRQVLHRYIDATPGIGLVALMAERKAPAWDALKKGKVSLTDEERSAVLQRKAVWHHGRNGEETPAVWKTQVGGETWFVTNTHRLYQASPTLEGAIGRYHKVVKQTA